MKYLLILDELQAIVPKRGNDTTNENTFDRLLSCLLTTLKKQTRIHLTL